MVGGMGGMGGGCYFATCLNTVEGIQISMFFLCTALKILPNGLHM